MTSSNSNRGIQYTPVDSIATVSTPQARQPVGQSVQIVREAVELPHRLIVAIGRHGHEVCGAADVDAGGVGVGDRQGKPGLARLETDGDCVAPWLAPSFSCGMWRRMGYVVLLTLSNGMTAREPANSRATHQCR